MEKRENGRVRKRDKDRERKGKTKRGRREEIEWMSRERECVREKRIKEVENELKKESTYPGKGR
eukprot:820200-Amorphochlora_amoeboformis.AAC.1